MFALIITGLRMPQIAALSWSLRSRGGIMAHFAESLRCLPCTNLFRMRVMDSFTTDFAKRSTLRNVEIFSGDIIIKTWISADELQSDHGLNMPVPCGVGEIPASWSNCKNCSAAGTRLSYLNCNSDLTITHWCCSSRSNRTWPLLI